MRLGWSTLACVVGLASGVPSPARGHIDLIDPPSRYGRGELKYGPCGVREPMTSQATTRLPSGATITVVFDEYIDHPGHYRLAFDADGDDVFEDPRCLADCERRKMQIEVRSEPWILLDGIPDRKRGGLYEIEVTLPDIECSSCTLQLIQVMTDKPPYELPGNDLYYQCADLILERPAQPDAGMDLADAAVGEPDVRATGAPDAGEADAMIVGPDAELVDLGAPDAVHRMDARAADAGDGGTPAPSTSTSCRSVADVATPTSWIAVIALFRRRRTGRGRPRHWTD